MKKNLTVWRKIFVFFFLFSVLSFFLSDLLYLLMVPFVLHHCLTQSRDIFLNMNTDLLIEWYVHSVFVCIVSSFAFVFY